MAKKQKIEMDEATRRRASNLAYMAFQLTEAMAKDRLVTVRMVQPGVQHEGFPIMKEGLARADNSHPATSPLVFLLRPYAGGEPIRVALNDAAEVI